MELTSQANLLRISDIGVAAGRPQPSAEIVSLPMLREPSRYGEGRRPNIVAMAASIGLVTLMLSSLLTMNVVGRHKAKPRLTVVELLRAPEPPPPQEQPKPVKAAAVPSPIVAPPPLVQSPAPPPIIATSPTPPPQVTVPAPPSPAPPAPVPVVAHAGDLSSTMIEATPPRYPIESRRKREQGTVVLTVVLALDGTVADLSVSRSSGFDRLDQAALAAVRRWRWSPTRRAGVPVMVKGLVEIPFILQGKGGKRDPGDSQG